MTLPKPADLSGAVAVPEDGVPPEKWLRLGPFAVRALIADRDAAVKRAEEAEAEVGRLSVYGPHIDGAKLQRDLAMAKLESEAASSMMLSVQQDCIAEKLRADAAVSALVTARSEERERCAVVCDRAVTRGSLPDPYDLAAILAARIRALPSTATEERRSPVPAAPAGESELQRLADVFISLPDGADEEAHQAMMDYADRVGLSEEDISAACDDATRPIRKAKSATEERS